MADVENADTLTAANTLADNGHTLEAIAMLETACLTPQPAALHERMAELRFAGFCELDRQALGPWPPPAPHGISTDAAIPEIDASGLDVDAVRDGILGSGSLIVRGLFTDHAAEFVDGIDRACATRRNSPDDPTPESPWYRTLPLPEKERLSLSRPWVRSAGGLLACDSPWLLGLLLRRYDDVGLREIVTEYLGERPVLSANKTTMRLVPLDASTDWHQDGAFLGEGLRSLNIWVALSDCGIDSPGMDIIPRRFDRTVETGTGGAIFDWAVGPDTVSTVAADTPAVRPRFRAGDAMLFDELCLHRTAVEPAMQRPRYAIESWFFAPSVYPAGQVPIVW